MRNSDALGTPWKLYVKMMKAMSSSPAGDAR